MGGRCVCICQHPEGGGRYEKLEVVTKESFNEGTFIEVWHGYGDQKGESGELIWEQTEDGLHVPL